MEQSGISIHNPLEDYKALVERHMLSINGLNIDYCINIFKSIGKEIQCAIWRILFDTGKFENKDVLMACELIEAYRCDAATYGLQEYNKWLENLRNELVNRQMITIWEEHIVRKSLGPIEFGTGIHNFHNSEQDCVEKFESVMSEEEITDFEAIIGTRTPLLDYQKLMEERVNVDFIISEDIALANYKKISTAVRNTVWTLLFLEKTDRLNNEIKAADLMAANKLDAALFEPWEYNEWVFRLRNKLLDERKLRFWRTQMVRRQLGPCSGKDCTLFLNKEYPPVKEFYNVLLVDESNEEPIVID
ncbi:uncharacterized protein LOC119689736 [Teleopsis dalmanni]|uniref:uncharacterized protein LOC119689736 n=1 Tax=Teleopsis dalmanni TaxID=139649 RepID=UPI000D32A9CF|nr:uncharacterized protein LOC119689736 [Teleopsis dalmanni]